MMEASAKCTNICSVSISRTLIISELQAHVHVTDGKYSVFLAVFLYDICLSWKDNKEGESCPHNRDRGTFSLG